MAEECCAVKPEEGEAHHSGDGGVCVRCHVAASDTLSQTSRCQERFATGCRPAELLYTTSESSATEHSLVCDSSLESHTQTSAAIDETQGAEALRFVRLLSRALPGDALGGFVFKFEQLSTTPHRGAPVLTLVTTLG